MRVTKRVSVAALGVSAAAVLLGAGVASADPTVGAGENGYDRPLQGVGSDTLDDVMNGLSEVVVNGSNQKLIASWNAVGGAFTTRSAANTPSGSSCTYASNSANPGAGYTQGTRANGSGSGQKALRDAFTSGSATFGCLDFSRSSGSPSAGNLTGVQTAAIPLATDSIAFAINRSSLIPRTLTAGQLKAIYHCTFGGTTNGTWKAYLPQAGSGTRSKWEEFVGITEADVVAGTYPCVTDVAPDGSPVQEHDGRFVPSNGIFPYSTAQWISQMGGAVTDKRGNTMLGTIKGSGAAGGAAATTFSYPVTLNGGLGQVGGTDSITLTRTVYNLLPTATLNGGANPNPSAVLAFQDTDPGSANTSLICQRSDVIQKFGFSPISTCGSIATTVN